MDIPPGLQRDFDRMMDSVEWHETAPPVGEDAQLPYETHRATVHLGDVLPGIDVVQLSDGRRLITEASMHALLKALGLDLSGEGA